MSTMSQFFGGGGGAGFKLAPDLTFPSSKSASVVPYRSVTINPAGSLTTALSLTGKWLVNWLKFAGLPNEFITIKLTIDGVIIWNDTFATSAGDQDLLGWDVGAVETNAIVCDSTFLLELQTATDTSVVLSYIARPIL